MRIISVFCVFLLLASLAVGCSFEKSFAPTVTLPYEIIENDNEYCLVMRCVSSEVDDGVTSSQICVPSDIVFDSINEMIDDIKTGNFSQNELDILASFPRNNENQIQICNINELYVPILPNDLSVEKVFWRGMDYCFLLNLTNGTGRRRMHVYTPEKFQEATDIARNFPNATECKVQSISTEAERNATVTYYINGIGKESKHIYYNITKEAKTLHIVENYILEESKNTPNSVRIYGSDNGVYFYYWLASLTERPSVEWLSQFGIREYVETSTS